MEHPLRDDYQHGESSASSSFLRQHADNKLLENDHTGHSGGDHTPDRRKTSETWKKQGRKRNIVRGRT